MSIKVEDYYAPATFQRMKAFADTQETPFVVIDTAIISQAYDDLRAGFEFAKRVLRRQGQPSRRDHRPAQGQRLQLRHRLDL